MPRWRGTEWLAHENKRFDHDNILPTIVIPPLDIAFRNPRKVGSTAEDA